MSKRLDESVGLMVAFNVPENDNSRHDSLTYYLARYNITGHFSGKFIELKTQLNGCPMTYKDV